MIDTQQIVDSLSMLPQVEAIYLLGSAAHGNMRPDSDVDIALLVKNGQKIDNDSLSRSVSELSLKCGREIDIGYVSTQNLVYSRQALLTGKRIFARNTTDTQMREATLLGLYAQFQLDRREVIDAYKA